MSNIQLTIDGREVEATPGQTVLEAARKLGVDIPTLCFLERCTPATSCLVCLVKWKANGQTRMVPSCATKVQPGMVIESETEEVREARRTALELLLSDHVGDCLSPCHRICPLHLNIPLMIRQIETGRLQEAMVTVRSALPLPGVLARLCHRPCENGCRRGTCDQPAAIRDLERYVADTALASEEKWLPPREAPSGKSVVIVGSGPTGLAAADLLLRRGHACTIVDRQAKAGGALRLEKEAVLPIQVLQHELGQLERLGVQFKLEVELGTVVTLDGLLRGFDVVLLAPGELSPSEAAAFGLTASGNGLQVNAETFETSMPGVFAAGSAVKPVKQIVRALSEGQVAGQRIDHFVRGQEMQRPVKSFSSMMGRLEKGEVELFLQQASSVRRVTPVAGHVCGFNQDEAHREAARCLHCDCRAAGNCKLQEYAQRYQADANRFREQRRRFEQQTQNGGVIFERGKCILCGICVQLTEQAREPLGLTFIGRGFDVRIGTPFNRSIAEGLQRVATACVENCPTGALVFADKAAVNQPPPEPLPNARQSG
jgi:NADPH-dependent glutamate synthase beta subunit-like oxidoreductase